MATKPRRIAYRTEPRAHVYLTKGVGMLAGTGFETEREAILSAVAYNAGVFGTVSAPDLERIIVELVRAGLVKRI